MTITREINGEKVEITLTGEEIYAAHAEHVTNFMFDKLVDDFEYSVEVAKALAVESYDEYCQGNGLTEYECIEAIVEQYEKGEIDISV